MDPRRDLSLSCRESEGSWEAGLALIDEETWFLFHPSTKLWCGDLSVQFSSVTQTGPTLCNPMNRSPPGLPVHHQLPESTQTMSIESVMPSNHLILCRPLLFLPSIFSSIRVFSNEFQFFTSGGHTIGVSASTSVLPVNTQD